MLLNDEVTSFIHDMEPTNHIILFYDTKKSKRNILNTYIADGLENEKGGLYVCYEETPDQIRTGMKSFGIDVDKNEKSGKLQIQYYDPFYIENGIVDPLKIINHWQNIYGKMKELGFGLRGTGELSCFFDEGKVRELLHYEYALHRVLSIPMEAICAYSVPTIVKTGYTEMIMPLIRAHGGAIFTAEGGTMIVEPEEVEKTDVEELLKIQI
ncbi:MAG: MEDS domain-containing protein [Candidatus Bathyarchaeota archaeon]|jgi:hypothetical protein